MIAGHGMYRMTTLGVSSGVIAALFLAYAFLVHMWRTRPRR
jgi:hypothetical protein